MKLVCLLLSIATAFRKEAYNGQLIGERNWPSTQSDVQSNNIRVVEAEPYCQFKFAEACTAQGGDLVRVVLGFKNCKSIEAKTNWYESSSECNKATLDKGRVT